mmetsp:Transcript_2529/g.7271  ORF Transcript_2529/g.7271 Transcript_2529/m.7271 type:complete len:209 (-) Transcript_2529:5520-6146(-)
MPLAPALRTDHIVRVGGYWWDLFTYAWYLVALTDLLVLELAVVLHNITGPPRGASIGTFPLIIKIFAQSVFRIYNSLLVALVQFPEVGLALRRALHDEGRPRFYSHVLGTHVKLAVLHLPHRLQILDVRDAVGVEYEVLEGLREGPLPGQYGRSTRLLVALLGPGLPQQGYDVARVNPRIATDELPAAFGVFQGRLLQSCNDQLHRFI